MYVCTVVTSYPKWRFLSREIAVTPSNVKSHVGQSEYAVGLRLSPESTVGNKSDLKKEMYVARTWS